MTDRQDYLKWLEQAQDLLLSYINQMNTTFHNFRIFQEELHSIYENNDNKTQIRKKRILCTFRNQLKYVESRLKEVENAIGPMTRNQLERMFDYDIALLKTYASGTVYDDNGKNIYK